MAEIMGYSERGLVNALFESIVAMDEPLDGLKHFLQTAVAITSKDRIQQFHIRDDIDTFRIYIEPSLSQFGNPDAVILLQKNSIYSEAIFIEAKLCSFINSIGKRLLDRNSSSILHELFLKMRFSQLLRSKDGLKTNVRIYKEDKRPRSIGADPVVLDLVKEMSSCSRYYFIALTADKIEHCKQTKKPYSLCSQIEQKFHEIDNMNTFENKNSSLFKPFNVINNTYLLSWYDIIKTTRELHKKGKDMKRFINTLEWNESKFRLPGLHWKKSKELLEEFVTKLGCRFGEERNSFDRLTIYNCKGNRALFTCRILDSFNILVLEAYLRKKAKVRENIRIPIHCIQKYCINDTVESQLDILLEHVGKQ